MTKEKQTEENHRFFVQSVVENQAVWYLQKADGCARSLSVNQEHDVYLFWASKHAAEKCAQDEWHDYTPTKVILSEFMEVWCIPLYEQEVLMGPQWTTDLLGKEIHPLLLLRELIQEVRLKDKEEQLSLLLFDDLCDIEQVVDEVLDEAV